MQHSAELRRCLEECDVAGARKLWRQIAPHLHQPATDHEAEATIHRARTEMAAMIFRLRAYSHRWLVDHGYPSALPDELRPRAERIYPRIAEGVGIAVKVMSELFRPAAPAIMSAMSDAVMDAYADGKTDPGHIKARIMEARRVAIKRLLGTSIVAFFACAFFGLAAAQMPMPITLFGTSTPHNPDVTADTSAVTLGVKFSSTQVGTVDGIRFYRAHKASSSGYTVKLFSASGALLASQKTASDTCAIPCWEQVNFASPISLAANTTYVAAYYTANGNYADDEGTNGGLTNAVKNGSLTASASATVGGNGVYIYSTGFPNQTWHDSNYYVDVSFTVTAPTLQMVFNPPSPTISSSAPAGTAIASVSVSWNNGAPFTGSLNMTQAPYADDSHTFALSGSNIIINPSGPGVGTDGGTTQNITVQAVQ